MADMNADGKETIALSATDSGMLAAVDQAARLPRFRGDRVRPDKREEPSLPDYRARRKAVVWLYAISSTFAVFKRRFL